MANLNLDFSNVLPTYEDALKASTLDVSAVKDAIAKAGIKASGGY